MLRDRGRGAFTLVELLVVIGIITILVGILLPVMNKVRQSAMEAVCMSNMRQLGYGVVSYANQNYGSLPVKGPDGSNTTTNDFGPTGGVVGFDDASLWFNAIPPLVSNKSYYEMLLDNARGYPAPHAGGPASIFICPMAAPSGTLNQIDVIIGDYFMLNGIDSTGQMKNSTGLATIKQFPFAMSYVWNSKISSTIKYGDQGKLKLSECEPSTECIIMVEKLTTPGEYLDPDVQRYNTTYPSVYNGKIVVQGYSNNIGQSKADYRRFTTRHRHGGHLLFADSHVAWFSWTDVQPPGSAMPGGVFNANTTDANQPGKVVWSAIGPIN